MVARQIAPARSTSWDRQDIGSTSAARGTRGGRRLLRRGRRLGEGIGAVVQGLESRLLLNAANISIPATIDPATAAFALFAPGATQVALPHATPGSASQYLKFAMDGTIQVESTRFDLAPAAPSAGNDAALALYDSSGNLLATADADATAGNPGAETLVADITNRQSYVLGIFFAPAGPTVDYTLSVTSGPQAIDTDLTVNPLVSFLQYNAVGVDGFDTPEDVDYYNVSVLDAAGGAITILPTAADVTVAGTLFRREDASQPWTPVATNVAPFGSSALLPLAAPAGKTPSDEQYMLAVATANFTGAAGSYRITVSESATLAPAYLPSLAGITDFGTPGPVSLGVAGASANGNLTVGAGSLYQFRTPAAGNATITVQTSAFKPVISLYNGSGSSLLAVASNTTAGPVTLSFAAAGNTTYVFRVGDTAGNAGGAFNVSLSTPSQPTPVALSLAPTTVYSVPLDGSQAAQFYRIQPVYNTDVLVLSLSASTAAAKVTLYGTSLGSVTQTVAAGQALFMPVAVSGKVGPFDVYVAGGAGTDGTADLTIGQFTIPQQISPNTLTPAMLDISGNTSATVGMLGFGSRAGLRYYSLDAKAPTLFTAQDAGLRPLLARYEETGGVLHLVDFDAPDSAGLASLSEVTGEQQLQAVVAYQLGMGSGGSLQVSVDAPIPQPIGVATLPDLTTKPSVQSILKIDGVTLLADYQQHLWNTILPFNLTDTPTVKFTPLAIGGDLKATVSVYAADSQGRVTGSPIGTMTNVAGQATQMKLAGTVSSFAGKRLVFRVVPTAGSLDDGQYTLVVTEPTPDPMPYLLPGSNQQLSNWWFPNMSPPAGANVLPNQGYTELVQNQFGEAEADATFTSSTPNTSGSLHVYRFWAPSTGPVDIKTSDIDPAVNTTIGLFQAHFNASGQVDYLQPINGIGPSQDWYPADRSEIDARIYINSFQSIAYPNAGGGMYFIIVKNEQGSLGQYHISVDTGEFPGFSSTSNAPGSAVTYIPPTTGGTVTMQFQYLAQHQNFTGYFPVQLPQFHSPSLSLSSSAFSYWDMAAFDPAGNRLPGTTDGGILNTWGTFTVPPGPQIVYLRLHVNNGDPMSTITLSNSVSVPAGITQPIPANGVPAKLFVTDPFGNGSLTDNITALGTGRMYSFQAADGPLTVSVVPDSASDPALTWAVYADGNLLAWDTTQVSGGTIVPGNTTATVLLPKIRQFAAPEDSYDHNYYHNIQVYVSPLGTAAAGSKFTLSTSTTNTLPMRDGELTMNPLDLHGTVTANPTGNDWLRLSVPDKLGGSVSLDVTYSGLFRGTVTMHYDLYDPDGTLVSSKTANTTSADPGHLTFTLDGAEAGHSYFLRVGLPSIPSASVQVTASGYFAKNAPVLQPLIGINALPSPWARPPSLMDFVPGAYQRSSPKPDGHFAMTLSAANTATVAAITFWVQSPGMVHIGANFTGAVINNPYIAVYRGYRTYSEVSYTDSLELVDFVNNANVNADNSFDLNTYLTPGLYALRIVSSQNVTNALATVRFDLPAYTPQEIVIDPNTGGSNINGLPSIDVAPGGMGLRDTDVLTPYRTTFYHVVTPSSSTNNLTANASQFWPGYTGLAYLQIWDFRPNFGYAPNSFPDGALSVTSSSSPVITLQTAAQTATPGKEYWIALNRNGLAGATQVDAVFQVPQSGTPDLSVSIQLLPDNGHTRVGVTVNNKGFATASVNHATLTFIDNTNPNSPNAAASARLEQALGPFAVRTVWFDWTPLNPEDTVGYVTDVNKEVAELDETNNSKTVALSTVDPHRPSVALSLGTPSLDGNSDPDVWGRYVSTVMGVSSDIVITSSDPDNDLYITTGTYPPINPAVQSPVGAYLIFSNAINKIPDYDFGRLFPSTPQNPNIVRMQAQDEYGLLSPVASKTIQVVPFPRWLNAPTDSMTWDSKKKQYVYDFQNSLVDVNKTLNDLVGGSFPMVGDDQNRFLIEVLVHGTATLDPTVLVDAPVKAHVLLKVLDNTIYEKTFGKTNLDSNISFDCNLYLDRVTLDANNFNVTFALKHLQLFNWTSPEIPLFAYGIPEVIDIEADLQFHIGATLDAAITFAIDPSALSNPLDLHLLGLASPTFIMPTLSLGADLSGNVKVLGFDIASLGGGVTFMLSAAYGLTTQPDDPVPFSDFFDPHNSALGIKGSLYLEFKAKLLGIPIFSYKTPTYDLFHAGGAVVIDTQGNTMDAGDLQPTATFYSGDSAVGPLELDSTPQIIIDPVTGKSLFLQVVNGEASSTSTVGALAFAQRNGGTWSPLSILNVPENVAYPVLSWTHDGVSPSAVVVYQATNFPGDPKDHTRNQYIAGQDIRYRYFDGSNWSSERSITSDSLYDSGQTVAFNNAGQGVLAWVHNTNPSPLNSQGSLDRAGNEIQVAIWNKTTHAWSAPITLTNDSISDSNPAAYADENGKLYVAWLKDTASGNQIMYSTYTGTGWSAPAVLQTGGLIPGGQVGELAFGSNGAGRIELLMSDKLSTPGQPTISRLFTRSTTLAAFNQLTNVDTIALDQDFSHLRTVRDPQGGLVAYWQQSNGAANEVFTSRQNPLGVAPQTWSTPVPVTSGDQFEYFPSMAIEPDGTYQVVYEPGSVNGQTTPSQDPAVSGLPAGVGVASSSRKLLPELSFIHPLTFNAQSQAPAGMAIDGTARIINTGLVGSNVEIDYYTGTPGQGGTQVGSQVIHLNAGDTYDIDHVFTILPGTQTYTIQLKAVNSAEAITTADDTSSTTVIGLPELTISSITLDDPEARAGDSVNVMVQVTNNSSLNVGAFDVDLTLGDPRFVPGPHVLLGSLHRAAGLAGFGTATFIFPWTIPATGGTFVLAANADSGNAIAEAIEDNNISDLPLVYRPDPAIVRGTGTGPVTATVLNQSGVRNVQVQAVISNLGEANLVNLPVQLLWALDDGDFQSVATGIVPSLAAGAQQTVTFTTSGLAGRNRYRVLADPQLVTGDADPSNNVGETVVSMQGMADLSIPAVNFFPTQLVHGGPLTAHVTVANTGIKSASNVLVEVFSGTPGAGGRLIGQTTIPHMAALSSVVADIAMDTSMETGNTRITAIVDRPDKVLETSELNNTWSAVVNFVQPNPATVNGTAGNDTIYLKRDAAGIEVYFNGTGTGTPAKTLSPLITSLTVNGLGGQDTIILDLSGGLPLAEGANTIGGTDAGDIIDIRGTSSTTQVRVTDSQLFLGETPVNYSNAAIQFGRLGSGTPGSTPDLINLGSLEVDGSASVSLVPANSTGAKVMVLNGLVLQANAALNVRDGELVLQPGAASRDAMLKILHDLAKMGRNGGTWDGHGIDSFTSQAGASASMKGVVVVPNDRGNGHLLVNSVGGVQVGADAILVKSSWNGDADLNGRIDADDYFRLDQGLLRGGSDYYNGDLDYSGGVNGDDYSLIDAAFLGQKGGTQAADSQPSDVADAAPQQDAAASAAESAPAETASATPLDDGELTAVPALAPTVALGVQSDAKADDKVFLTDDLAVLA